MSTRGFASERAKWLLRYAADLDDRGATARSLEAADAIRTVTARVADLEAACADYGEAAKLFRRERDEARAEAARLREDREPQIFDVIATARALVGDETPGTGEHA